MLRRISATCSSGSASPRSRAIHDGLKPSDVKANPGPNVSAEIVVETGADVPCGSVPRISEMFLRTCADIGHFARRWAFKVDEDRRGPGLSCRNAGVDVLRFLQLAFGRSVTCVNVSSSSAGPRGLHTTIEAEREGRILVSSEPVIRHQARDDDREHREHDKDLCFSAQSEGWDRSASSQQTNLLAGCNAWTPAVTTISPPSGRSTTTVRIEPLHLDRQATVKLAGSTIQTAGFLPSAVSALAGMESPCPRSISILPVTVAPGRIAAGGSFTATRLEGARHGIACGSTMATRPFARLLGIIAQSQPKCRRPAAPCTAPAPASKTDPHPLSRA